MALDLQTCERLRGDLRAALEGSSADERAMFIYDVLRDVGEFVKFHAPEGGGLDGRNGPEREALGRMADMALIHMDTTAQRAWASNPSPRQGS